MDLASVEDQNAKECSREDTPVSKYGVQAVRDAANERSLS